MKPSKEELKLDRYLREVCANNEKCQHCDFYHPYEKYCFFAVECVKHNFKEFVKKRED